MKDSVGFQENNTNISKTRVIVLGVLIVIVFLLYLGFLFHMQVIEGAKYQNRAKQVSSRSVTIPSQRGEIYDRNYDVPLVVNVNSYAVSIIPGRLKQDEFQTLFKKISEVLDMSIDEIKEKLPAEYRHLYQPVEVKSGVKYETIIKIAEHYENFKGVIWQSKPIRHYVETGSLAHILGYVGDITREEIQVLYNKGYSFGSVIGKSGIEKEYDQVLKGEPGKRFRTVDVKGRHIDSTVEKEIPPAPGQNLILTIERHIQEVSEKALGKRNGAVVVLKPHTGEILSMVSYPWYDPNIFIDKKGKQEFSKLSLDKGYPFVNRAIQSAYPPASLFKTIMATAMVEENVMPVDKTVTCSGSLRYGDRVFNCWKRTGHGPVDLEDAIAHSCNVYFYTIGKDYLSIERIVEYARKFGLGQKTGIDLPGEISGLVPSPMWKQNTYNTSWYGGDTLNTSIGQGYTMATPLQMANVIAMIANGGTIYKPHLVKEIRDPSTGEITEKIEPEVLHSTSIREQTFKNVRDGMRKVVKEGTAQFAITTDAVKVAGKTGTSETGKEERFGSWFAAYAPYNAENPEDKVVVLVMVEASDEWEWWAPKAANIILHSIFTGYSFEETVADLRLGYLFR